MTSGPGECDPSRQAESAGRRGTDYLVGGEWNANEVVNGFIGGRGTHPPELPCLGFFFPMGLDVISVRTVPLGQEPGKNL